MCKDKQLKTSMRVCPMRNETMVSMTMKNDGACVVFFSPEHVSPANPGRQKQRKLPTVLRHSPPLSHGELVHSSVSDENK